ncbi:glycosyl transferase family 1 [Candidatus Magnetomorum sp. HK-1]|nr:glycosyl transferase family 1 [Candidatus Magnetomorum sp. HK-1]
MTEKKIALIRSGYSPFGGVETHALNLIRKLLENNVRIVLLTWPNQNWPIQHPNLEIVELGHNQGNRLYQAWDFNRSVRRYLSNNHFACVLSMDQVDTCTHIHAGGGSHKVFLKIKNKNSPAIKRFFRKFSLFHRYLLAVERKAFTHSGLKKIRCCSTMVQQDISYHYNVPEEKMAVIYNSVDWKGIGKSFEQRESIKNELLNKYSFQSEWKMLLFLGSGFMRKGLDIAIKGLKYIDSDFHLLVIGKGSEKPFQQIANSFGLSDRVHILGPQENGWRFSAICQGIVLPSRYEPFGRAAAEAQAMGLPALVSDRNGYSELINEKQNGIVLKSPMTDQEIMSSFQNFANMINHPVLTPDEIRNQVKVLDDELVVQQLIKEFLCL